MTIARAGLFCSPLPNDTTIMRRLLRPRTAFILLALAMLAGCATGYGPQGYTGGYIDTKIEEDVYRIRYSGNGMTSRDKVWQYWIYRCAELTTQKGYSHFMLLKTGEPVPAPQADSSPAAGHAYQRASAGDEGDPLSRATPAATRSAPIYIFTPSTPVIKYANEGSIKMVNNPAAYPGRTMLRADVILKLVGPYVQTGGKTRAPSEQELLKAAIVTAPGTPAAPPTKGRVTLDDLKYLLPPP